MTMTALVLMGLMGASVAGSWSRTLEDWLSER